MCHKIGCIQPILGADHKPYLMGWVADVIIPADIKQPEEEIMIIRKPVGLPRYELGFIVDPFHLSLGHVIGRMSDDLLEIVCQLIQAGRESEKDVSNEPGGGGHSISWHDHP